MSKSHHSWSFNTNTNININDEIEKVQKKYKKTQYANNYQHDFIPVYDFEDINSNNSNYKNKSNKISV